MTKGYMTAGSTTDVTAIHLAVFDIDEFLNLPRNSKVLIVLFHCQQEKVVPQMFCSKRMGALIQLDGGSCQRDSYSLFAWAWVGRYKM